MKAATEFSAGKRAVYGVVMAALAFLCFALLAEMALRLAAGNPAAAELHSNEPTVHEPDAVLGWRNQPGHYAYPAYPPGTGTIVMTFLADSRRSSGAVPRPGGRRVVLLGCSFTQGWAISDDETCAWQLQRRFPDIEFINYGTGGYGTYQALLMLERYFERNPAAPPALVVYGFIDAHEARNVAPWWWLKGLAQQARRGHVRLPYATLDRRGALARHPPEGYPQWPGERRLALVRFTADFSMRLKTFVRRKQRREVTERLLLEMRRLCAARGSALLVPLLNSSGDYRRHYTAFLQQHGIAWLDCTRELTPHFTVPGEGHPNGALNGIWADALGAEIQRRWP
jgi:hypothetical protein